MPAHVRHDPLRVEFVFPDGSRYTALFDATANHRLAAELAAGFPELVHPHGVIGTRGTAVHYASALRVLVRWLAFQGFTGGLADLTRPLLLRYWLEISAARADLSRTVLRAAHQASGSLAPDVVPYLDGRPLKARPRSRPHQPYTEGEWQRITDALRQAVRETWDDHRRAVADAAEGEDPRVGGLTRTNIAWTLVQHGPMSTLAFASHVGSTHYWVEKTELTAIREALYPSAATATAYRLLLGVYSGVVPDGVAGLGIGDVTWSGDSAVLLGYIKGRSGPESVTLTGRPVRLIERWLNHSSLLRRHAKPDTRDELWLRSRVPSVKGESNGYGYVISGPNSSKTNMRASSTGLTDRMALVDDAGAPLRLHSGRIRTTYLNTLSRKGWMGNTAIDPNHSTAVEGDRYLTAQTPAQRDAVETIIEESQADILRRALPPVVLSQEAAARAAADLPAAAGRLGVTDGALAELLGGERDVFTASCRDPLSGIQGGPAGKPCPARPWVCLLCPLAVFLPRHATNLLRLRAYFARQQRQLTISEFIAVFGPYADRLDREILPAFPAAALEAAAAGVADTDVEIPVRPEETTV
ncbi:hypothetical protein ACIPYQ_22720 [Streptomyces sp. NPDC090045]|uniref:hypothetical protein n=1 Tax=Streptomyces sp. NPDC090045 TaxID=3365927 RepID=UPI00381A27C9